VGFHRSPRTTNIWTEAQSLKAWLGHFAAQALSGNWEVEPSHRNAKWGSRSFFPTRLESEIAAEPPPLHFPIGRLPAPLPGYARAAGAAFAETRGICCLCSPLLMAEFSPFPKRGQHRSRLEQSGGFAYRIRLWMRPDAPRLRAQLRTRRWVICDPGAQPEVEIVEGEGVVGEYPTMFPGAFFEYASRTNLQADEGCK
jgi:hypothetical protein